MILESFQKAEEDLTERQLREARVEADAVLGAVEKARQEEAYLSLNEEERAAIDLAVSELLTVQNGNDHNLIRDKIEGVDKATQNLAEAIINSVAMKALGGKRIDGDDGDGAHA